MDEEITVEMKPVRCNLKGLYPALLLLTLSVVCYWKMFDNYFYLDDTNGVFAGYLLSHDITKIFTYNFEAIYMSPLRRVVVALSYIPNYLISGYDPWSYYLANLLLHFGNSFLVYLIVKKLSGNKNLALLTAVLFSASLNKADAVMMIAHRTTLMGAFFALLTVFLYIRIIMEGYNRRLFLSTLLAFVAALGSYETALVLPGFFIVLGLIYRGRDFFKKEFLLVNASFLSFVIILVLFLGLQPGVAVADTSIIEKIFHIFRNVLAVFPSFIVPPFVLQQPNEVYHSTSAYFGWIELLSLALIGLIVMANLRLKDRLIYFGLLFFLIAAIPTATVNWGYYPEFPEHRLRFSIGKYSYLSSFGFYLIAGVLINKAYYRINCLTIITSQGLKFVSFTVLGIYLIFNVYSLYGREKSWDSITKKARNQASSLISVKLNLNDYSNVFIGEPLIPFSSGALVLYSKHAESLYRVIYNNPDLAVRDIREYQPGSDKGKNLLLIANEDGMTAFELLSDIDSYIVKQIR